MSSSVSSTLSAGAQLLANYNTLLPGPPESDLAGARQVHPAAPAPADAAIPGSAMSAEGDTVELSTEAMQMLAQMGHGTAAGPSSSHVANAYSAAPAYERIDYFG